LAGAGRGLRAAGASAAPAARSEAAPARAVPPGAAGGLADVVARAGEELLREAQAVVAGGPRELVIDPLIDASTGQQTAGTVQVGQQLAAQIKSRMPHWSVRPLTRTSLAGQPLLLIGTLTAINTKGVRELHNNLIVRP
jgi:hypothetical protein